MAASAFAGQNKTITLTDKNTVSLRDTVTWNSISQLQFELLLKAAQLDDSEPIYLVLDTPGGSVSAGEMLIDTINTIDNPVNVVVLFAASMGFQITQSANKRFIINSGTLMSHRATVGLKGQIDGELESQLNYIKSMVEAMEARSAKRIGLTLSDYKSKIVNEMWDYGQSAVNNNLADEVVNVKCSNSLIKKVEKREIFSFFGGSATVSFSKCPLITTPIDLANIVTVGGDDSEYFNLLFNNKAEFVNKYITTGKLTLK